MSNKEMIDHPAHYGGADNPYEAIKVIEAWQLDFCLGNAVKYIARAKHKGTELEDLKKAAWYLNHEIQKLEAVTTPVVHFWIDVENLPAGAEYATACGQPAHGYWDKSRDRVTCAACLNHLGNISGLKNANTIHAPTLRFNEQGVQIAHCGVKMAPDKDGVMPTGVITCPDCLASL